MILGDEVEEGEERYTFTWPGKKDAIRQSQTVSTATLRPCEEESVSADGTPGSWEGTENLYIEGDNLEVLKLLQAGYHGKVKLIYIDPPYNTGHDFVYKDKFGDTIENYKEQTAQADQSNPETAGRYHANWCSMMYPRLRLARELLSNDGAIFISIDDNEAVNLRKICDEVFGETNFKSDISWQKRYTRSNNTVDFTTMVEHVIVYSKTSAFEVNLLPRTDEADGRYGNPDNDPRGPWKGASFLNPASPEQRPNLCYPITNPNTGQVTMPTAKAWRRSRDEFNSLLEDGRLYWGSDGSSPVPSIKMYLSEARGLTPVNLWDQQYAGNTDMGGNEVKDLLGKKYFDFPKPTLFMKRILEHASKPGCIVLDFFSGSSSTADAVMQLNAEDGGSRKFLMVQLPEECRDGSDAKRDGFETICDIALERIRRAGKKIAAEVDETNQQLQLGEEPKRLPDIGFRVLKLDESGIVKPEPGQLLVDVVKPGRTELDIVLECMLKWGLEPSLPVDGLRPPATLSGRWRQASSCAAWRPVSPSRRSRPSPLWSRAAFSSSIQCSTTRSSSMPRRSSAGAAPTAPRSSSGRCRNGEA